MRNTFFALLIMFICVGLKSNHSVVKFTSNSELTIKGKSNVNAFECKYNTTYLTKEKIAVELTKNKSKLKFKGAKINIKSDGFDCANKLITKDLKSLLKSNTYNYITITLKELEENKYNYNAKIDVKIAGVEKEYIMPVTFNEKNLNVKGNLNIDIKDFKLKTPKKLLGIIKVDDTVAIDFNLFLLYN